MVHPGSMYCMPFVPSRLPAMGNLIKVLGKDLENCPHFFLDFESKCTLGRCLFGVSVSECVCVCDIYVCLCM